MPDLDLEGVRAQLLTMLGDVDSRGPLPAPTRYTTAAEDPLPGAVWAIGEPGYPEWRNAEVEVIAPLEDVGITNPGVALRGIDPSHVTDAYAMNGPAARRLALALLAAADMTGSPLIAQHCRRQDPS